MGVLDRIKRGYRTSQRIVDEGMRTGNPNSYVFDEDNRSELAGMEKDPLAIAGIFAGYVRRAPDVIKVVAHAKRVRRQREEKIDEAHKLNDEKAVDVDFSDDLVTLLDKESFPQALQENQYLIVDFYHNQCPPCKIFAPIYESAAEQHGEVIKFAKVNTRDNDKLAMQQKIKAVPTIIFYVNGEEKARVRGAMSRGDLEEFLKESSC